MGHGCCAANSEGMAADACPQGSPEPTIHVLGSKVATAAEDKQRGGSGGCMPHGQKLLKGLHRTELAVGPRVQRDLSPGLALGCLGRTKLQVDDVR